MSRSGWDAGERWLKVHCKTSLSRDRHPAQTRLPELFDKNEIVLIRGKCREIFVLLNMKLLKNEIAQIRGKCRFLSEKCGTVGKPDILFSNCSGLLCDLRKI
jgi:hypothetical protein